MRSVRDETFYCEQRRAIASGVLETAAGTFLLLIAVQYYQANDTLKSILAAGPHAGMIFSLLLVPWVARFRWSITRTFSMLCALGGIAYGIAALTHGVAGFMIGSWLALFLAAAGIPLMTQVYQNNYAASERGKLFSKGNLLRITAATLFSYLAGRFLSGHLERFPSLLAIYALALFAASFYLYRCPSSPLKVSASLKVFSAFRHVRNDSQFRWTLICWMILGIANLMMMPLRVEYLANPEHGVTLTTTEIALLLGVLPNAARLVLSRAWGWLFDHANFFAMRICLNLCFAAGSLAFFMGNDFPELILGSLLYGVAFAGGDVAWYLWVTKLAPPQHVAEYMSVHTFLTGCRGVIAPWIGFYLLQALGVQSTTWISIGMILFASFLLIPEIKNARKEAWMAGE